MQSVWREDGAVKAGINIFLIKEKYFKNLFKKCAIDKHCDITK